MRTARSLTVSRRILCTTPQPCMPPTTMHAPNHACPPQPRMPPLTTTHAPPPATTHAASNYACPPATMHVPRQPLMPPWTEFLTHASERLPCPNFVAGAKYQVLSVCMSLCPPVRHTLRWLAFRGMTCYLVVLIMSSAISWHSHPTPPKVCARTNLQ